MRVSTFVPSPDIIFGQSNSATIVLCMEVEKPEDPKLSRKAFIRRTAGATFSVASGGGFVDFDGHATGCKCSNCSGHDHGLDDHGDGCSCSNCNNGGVGGGDHVLGCQCGNCMRYGPLSAAAYERDVGDGSRSADSYAQNQQARETNARLEASGFKLDTKEEETARLNDAFASFSYDSVASTKTKGQKSQVGKGYGPKK